MAISWGAIDKKTIETGVDRGVLYTGTVSVPWDGLVSVTTKADGKELTPHYYQGVVYYVSKTPRYFSAAVEAYSYPTEFEPFQGIAEIETGFYADNQLSSNTFEFSYRTLVADGINGMDSGYKIHLIYNAVAIPTEKARKTINESIEATNFTWDFVCAAEYYPTINPTSHFIIDSRQLTSLQLFAIETLLYGPFGATPPITLPSIVELTNIISNPYALSEVSPGVYDLQYTPPGWTQGSPGVYDVTAFPDGWDEINFGIWEESV